MKKILIINIILVILLNSCYVCLANQEKMELIKYEKDCEGYLKYQGYFKFAHYAYYIKDGIRLPVYCVNPEYSGVTSELPEYYVKVNEKIDNEKVWKAIINGYPYKSLEELGVNSKEEAYTATQFAIYTVLHNRNIKDYESNGTEAGNRTLNAYLKIMENLKQSDEKMNEKIEVISEKNEWKIDENSREYLSKCYTIKSNILNGNCKIELKGNALKDVKIEDENGNEKTLFKINEKFKILVPINLLSDNLKFEINLEGELETKPILVGETQIKDTQNYALTGKLMEDFSYKYEEEIPKNTTKIKIIKQEKKSKNRIEGVKFTLLNSNRDYVIQDLITNENGEIIVEKLIPGTYFLQEISAPEKYNFNTEPIEIKIGLNEELEIIVTNSLKEIIKKEPEENVIVEIPKKLPITGF